ncbi:MAG TPA: HAMP domain-containing sensor histidine kinase [Thermoleophilaceae bacterium]|nr:HAMP domain-containing sensor histidine kinase [Thermoleophilaceae bacterium]
MTATTDRPRDQRRIPRRPQLGGRSLVPAFGGARARILASFLILLAFSTAATVIVIRQILLVRLEAEVSDTLVQETEEFSQLVQGRDPATGEPFGDDLRRIFDVYIDRNVPDDDEAIFTILNGQPYASIGSRQFPIEALAQREHWTALRRPTQKDVETSAGPARYLAVPIRLGGEIRGHFVVAEFMRGDRAEVADAVRIAALVSGSVLLIASLLAFFAAGRVLAPLRALGDTARSIHETDLTRRIDVEGNDELADLARTFNAMLDRVETAFETQRDFIRDASHELRTPITIVSGHLELMGDDPEERRATVDLVMDELARMSRLVDDLLLLARAERSDFLQVGPVDLEELAEELLAKASALAPRDWRLEAHARVTIEADRQRLTQAVMALADNAAQHTTDDDSITLGTAVEGSRIRLWVSDTGPGVSADDQRRIFDRFARGTSGPRRSDGSGLGLAIVKAIAEAHGGTVHVESRPGAGATFSLRIPT